MKLSIRLAHARQQLSTPGRGRTLILRRGLAGALVLAAGLSAAAGVREHPQVYVFARNVPAGSVVGDGDVELRRVPKEVIPAAALGPEDTPAGSVLVAAGSVGEVLTPARLLGVSDTTQSFSAPGLHMVPLKLAEPDIAALLHHGDTVSIVTAAAPPGAGVAGAGPDDGIPVADATPEPSAAALVAAGGRVVATALPEGGKGQARPGTILVALPAAEADRVAAASLSGPLTVVITGPRATG